MKVANLFQRFVTWQHTLPKYAPQCGRLSRLNQLDLTNIDPIKLLLVATLDKTLQLGVGLAIHFLGGYNYSLLKF